MDTPLNQSELDHIAYAIHVGFARLKMAAVQSGDTNLYGVANDTHLLFEGIAQHFGMTTGADAQQRMAAQYLN